MRALPKYIYRKNGLGFCVVIRRGNVWFRGYIQCGREAGADEIAEAVAKAVKLRDRLLKLAGPKYRKDGLSNTGVAGISETIEWRHNKPHHCFHVFLGEHHMPRKRAVYYGDFRPRAVAFAKAVEMRRAVGAKPSPEAEVSCAF